MIPEMYKEKPLVASWKYCDMDSTPLGVVGRYQSGADTKDIVPFFKGKSPNWQMGIDLKSRPLFGLEKLSNHSKEKAVFIVEGEKSAAALHGIGCAALTSLGGSNAASKADWTVLNGYTTVFLLPDNDEPGEKYIKDVYQILSKLPEPPKIKVLRLSGLPDKGDIVDWLKGLIGDWNGYMPIDKSFHQQLRDKLKKILKKAEQIPKEWAHDNTNIQWKAVKAIQNPLKEVDMFDFNLLPSCFIPWIKDISERMQCPPDYAAVGAMITLSAVIGRRIGIRPKARDEWLVVCNLWGLAVGRPSTMKTPVLDEVLKPLKRLENEEKVRHKENLKSFDIDIEMLKLANDKAKQKAKKEIGNGNNEKARSILEQAAEDEGEEPKRKRYIVYDATIEKLGELLNENPNGLLLFRDEIAGWLKTIDREDRANDREFWIESFAGTGSYTYDRIGRGTIDIEATTTSIIGGIQPAKLMPYIKSNLAGGKNDDGFVQRLQLAVYPDQQKEWKYIDRHPDKDAKNKVFNIYEAIANKIIFPETEEEENIPAINFDTEAQVLFIQWITELEFELRGNKLHPVMESHLTKYRSLIPSLALIIHIAELAEHEQFNLVPVSESALIKAILWGKYLRLHADRIYGIGLNTESTAAILMIKKIEEGKLVDGFTARDIKQNGWSGLGDNETVSDALQLLEDYNYLMGKRIKGSNRPTVRYKINPVIINVKRSN